MEALSVQKSNPYKKRRSWNLKRNWPLYAMLVPAIGLLLLFRYIPIYGIIIAFQDFQPKHGFLGSPFVGLKWFKYFLNTPDFSHILMNTLTIACGKIIFNTLASIAFALLLNEIKNKYFKRSIQTLVYLPNFLSWVIISGIFIDILSTKGIVNQLLSFFGVEPIFFLGSNQWFQVTLIATDTWKDFGWGAIIYIAALSDINHELYEAAKMDGAKRLQQLWHITLPGIMPVIILLSTLKLGSVLDAGFDQVLMLYNPSVYRTGDVLDTFVYRTGLMEAQFSLASAVGLFKSFISMILIILSRKIAYKAANYRIF